MWKELTNMEKRKLLSFLDHWKVITEWKIKLSVNILTANLILQIYTSGKITYNEFL